MECNDDESKGDRGKCGWLAINIQQKYCDFIFPDIMQKNLELPPLLIAALNAAERVTLLNSYSAKTTLGSVLCIGYYCTMLISSSLLMESHSLSSNWPDMLFSSISLLCFIISPGIQWHLKDRPGLSPSVVTQEERPASAAWP